MPDPLNPYGDDEAVAPDNPYGDTPQGSPYGDAEAPNDSWFAAHPFIRTLVKGQAAAMGIPTFGLLDKPKPTSEQFNVQPWHINTDKADDAVGAVLDLAGQVPEHVSQALEDTGVTNAIGDAMDMASRPLKFVSTLLHGNQGEQAKLGEANRELAESMGYPVKAWNETPMNAMDFPEMDRKYGLGEGAKKILAAEYRAAHPEGLPRTDDLAGNLFGHPLDRLSAAWTAAIGDETTPQSQQAPTAEQVAKLTALGGGTIANSPTYFDKNGELDIPEAAAHLGDFAKNMAISAPEDPLMWAHPGVSVEGDALGAARRAALTDAMRGAAPAMKFVPESAMEAFAKPTLGELTQKGMVGVGLKVPFAGDTVGFIPLPKSMAPIMDTFQPMFDALTKPITGPSAVSGNELMRKAAENQKSAAVAEFIRSRILPKIKAGTDIATAREFSPDMVEITRDLSEGMLNGFLRVTPKTLEGIGDVGLPLQMSVPEHLLPGWEKFLEKRPDLADQAQEAFATGPEHFQPQIRRALERLSTLKSGDQAAIYASVMNIGPAMEETRDFMAKQGVAIPELNGDVKALPKQLFDAMDAIDKRQGEMGYSKRAMGVRSQGGMVKLDEPIPGRTIQPSWDELNPLPTDEPYAGTSGVERNRYERELAQRTGATPPEIYIPSESKEFVAGEQPGRQVTESTSKTQMSKTLRALYDDVVDGKHLNAQQMDTLVKELQAEGPTNRMSVAEKATLRKALEERVPTALKEFNAAPSYVPGVIQNATKSELLAEASAKSRNKVAGSPQPQDAIRGLSPADLDKQYAELHRVKGTTAQGNPYYSAGTAATSGKAVGDLQGNWFNRFLTKTGLSEATEFKNFTDQNAASYFEPDPFKALQKQLTGPYLKALTNAQMDAQVLRLYDVIPKELVQKIRDAVYDEIDTGRTAPKGPFKFRNPPEEGSAEDYVRYNKERAAAQKAWDATEAVPITRPATLEDLAQIWKDAGRTDLLTENLSPSELKAHLLDGKDLKSVITTAWQPYGRDMLRIGEDAAEHGYVHSSVAKSLEDYKAFGNNPLQIAKWMNTNAPAVAYGLSKWKQASTILSPAFPGYALMKQLHDIARGQIEGLWDSISPKEIAEGQLGHFKYADTGTIDAMPRYETGNLSRDLPATPLTARQQALWMEQDGIIHPGREIGEGFDASPEPTAGIGGKTSSAVNGAIDATAKAAEKMQAIIRGQDNANRAAAYWSRIRAGDSRLEASLRVNKAMFDFTRRGPATAFAASTGLIPFAAWHAKVLPFMANWAVTNPGQFMVVQKALAAMGAGDIPVSALPAYLRDSTNLVTKVSKDDQGHTIISLTSDQGVIPGNDLMHFAKAVQENGSYSWWQGKLGPLPRMLLAAHDALAENEKDPAKKTAGQVLGSIAKAGLGRAGSVIANVFDPTKKTLGDLVNTTVNPMATHQFDLTKQDNASLSTAKSKLKASEYAMGQAAADAAKAEDAVRKATIGMAEADATALIKNDPVVLQAQQKLIAARATLAREQAEVQKRVADHQRLEKWLSRFERVK